MKDRRQGRSSFLTFLNSSSDILSEVALLFRNGMNMFENVLSIFQSIYSVAEALIRPDKKID